MVVAAFAVFLQFGNLFSIQDGLKFLHIFFVQLLHLLGTHLLVMMLALLLLAVAFAGGMIFLGALLLGLYLLIAATVFLLLVFLVAAATLLLLIFLATAFILMLALAAAIFLLGVLAFADCRLQLQFKILVELQNLGFLSLIQTELLGHHLSLVLSLILLLARATLRFLSVNTCSYQH